MEGMEFQRVALNLIKESAFNPRRHFDGKKFDDLVESVKQKGVLEPLLLRPAGVRGKAKGGKEFEIVAGARRYRAACAAALDTIGGPEKYEVPAMVREMDDDEAFEIMTIENLHREDLTELEEAEGFRAYLDRRGMGCIGELAEKTGIKESYIRRRVNVLKLPEKALKMWGEGKLKYGHLEQLARLTDKDKISGLIKYIIGESAYREYTVKSLKERIDRDAIPLGCAKFSTIDAGCVKCHNNTAVQTQLFDVEGLKGEQCLSFACFKKKQLEFLDANWGKTGYRKKHKTNGYRLHNDIDYSTVNRFYGKARKECLDCKDFVTIINVRGETATETACVGDKGCFSKKGKSETEKGRKGETASKGKAERRSEMHGEMFREEFYREILPERVEVVIDADPEKDARIKLFVLIKALHYLKEWLFTQVTGKNGKWWDFGDDDVWDALLKMSHTQLEENHKTACIVVAMRGEFGAEARKMVADHVGIDLKKEWRLTKEYLEKKTMAEIRAIAAEFGLFDQQKAKTFLYEGLLKKRGNFDACKKGELIRVILESGVELEGCVPQEILGVKREATGERAGVGEHEEPDLEDYDPEDADNE